MGLQRLLAGLAGADPVGLLDRHHEHLAVADLAGARVLEDRVDDRRHVTRGHHALELDLGPQPVGQLRAPVALGDPLLAPGALDLRDRQRREAEVEELHPDRLDRLVPDVRLALLHVTGPSFGVGAPRWVSRCGTRPGAALYPTSSGAGMNCSGYPYMP